MALQREPLFESDTSGATETIRLQPVSPATDTQATIASAFYGKDQSGDPKPAVIAADRKSLSITVLTGVNPISITLASPNPNNEIVQLVAGSTVLQHVVLSQHSAVTTVFIKGT